MSCHSLLLGVPGPVSPPHPTVSPGAQAVRLNSAAVRLNLPHSTSPLSGHCCFVPHISLCGLYQLTWAEFPRSVEDAVGTDSPHAPSQLASQGSSHHPGPDCIPSTTSFSQLSWHDSSKDLTQNPALGSFWLFLQTFLKLYSENCPANKSFPLL